MSVSTRTIVPAPVEAPAARPPLTILPPLPAGRRGNRFVQSLPSALEAIGANKGRSVLTTLGIIIGVAAVIAMVGLGQGASAQVTARFQGLGTDVLTVDPGSSQSGGVRAGAGTRASLTEADATAIQRSVAGVSRVSPILQGNAQVIAGNQNWQTRVQGVTPDYQQIQNWQMAEGGFFSADDDARAANVAVLGQTVVQNLFPNGQSPLGQTVRIRNVPFTVIGTLVSKGATGFRNQDDVIFIPFHTGRVRLFGTAALDSIALQVANPDEIDAVQQRVTLLLEQRHKLQPGQGDDFSVRNFNDIIQTAQGIAQTLTLLLAGVAAVSLIVGGIGIMNIMLVSVTERTREIGIRMAVGARPGDVLAQFLVEALMLSLLGGLIGVALGTAVTLGVPSLAGWPTALSPNAIALAFGFSALVGIFFGFYPARRASRLDPIQALRHE